MQRLNHIVLVHGAYHGGMCWQYVVPLLEAKGYRVSTPDLPGLGEDKTPPKDVTLQSYIDRVAETVRAAGEPVLLLGHSMSGSVTCAASEVVTEHVGKLVILAGGLNQNGESLASLLEHLASFGGPSMNAAIRPSTLEGAIELDPAMAGAMLYNTCSPEMVKHALTHLRPQAVGPFPTPLHLTAGRYGMVPKTYIVCLQDQVFAVKGQEWLCTRMPNTKRREINTDHSPFFSDPKGLVSIIDEETRL